MENKSRRRERSAPEHMPPDDMLPRGRWWDDEGIFCFPPIEPLKYSVWESSFVLFLALLSLSLWVLVAFSSSVIDSWCHRCSSQHGANAEMELSLGETSHRKRLTLFTPPHPYNTPVQSATTNPSTHWTPEQSQCYARQNITDLDSQLFITQK